MRDDGAWALGGGVVIYKFSIMFFFLLKIELCLCVSGFYILFLYLRRL